MLQSIWTIFNRTEISEGCTAYFLLHAPLRFPYRQLPAEPILHSLPRTKLSFRALGINQVTLECTEACCGSPIYPHIVWSRWLHRVIRRHYITSRNSNKPAVTYLCSRICVRKNKGKLKVYQSLIINKMYYMIISKLQ